MPSLIDYITSRFRKREPELRTTAEEIPQPSASPTAFANKFKAERERERVFNICNDMYETDPRAKGAIDKLARDTVRGGFSISVRNNPGAEEVARRMVERIKLQKRLDDWCREAYIEGDSLLEVSISEDEEIVDVTRKPTLQTRRNSDRTDRFADPAHAFWYHGGPVFTLDIPSDAIWFPAWQMIHARWAHRSKRKYGRPLFASATSAWKRVKEGELDIAVRRKTRAGMKYLHVVKGADETALKTYKRNNKDALDNPFAAVADFFSSEEGSVTAIQGDAKLQEIADVVHHIETFWTASPVPLAAVGYGQDLNRDVLEDKLTQYESSLDEITQWCEDQMLVPLLEREWLLHGFYPDNLQYEVIWKQKSTTTAKDLKDVSDAVVSFKALRMPDELVWAIVARWLPWLDLSSVIDQSMGGGEDADEDGQAARLDGEIP